MDTKSHGPHNLYGVDRIKIKNLNSVLGDYRLTLKDKLLHISKVSLISEVYILMFNLNIKFFNISYIFIQQMPLVLICYPLFSVEPSILNAC